MTIVIDKENIFSPSVNITFPVLVEIVFVDIICPEISACPVRSITSLTNSKKSL